ncbi:transient receptor potential cation channel subfamily V member 1-like [Gadus chalcogrammus]|uniref:transient receptor potential cation channel subfamily V member 1-like n=1 Tax=Gadus chalcogrammus TaxID=1042646 RepID=UPI0024C47592|nr:transient receptor potential cation channel subfamily V member 1-like [Gadus chalcogrammus]
MLFTRSDQILHKMNQSGTSDNLLGSDGGAPPQFRLPDSDPGGAAPPERAAAGSRWGFVGPAAEEEITGDPCSSPESCSEEDGLPVPGEKEKFPQLMEVDDRPPEERARLREQWQKQRTSSILSVLTMGCLRTEKPPMDSNNQEELAPDSPVCRFRLEPIPANDEERFDIDKLFEIVASGDVERLHGLKDYLHKTMKPLSHSLYQSHGKTTLMKALLNVSSGENEIVDCLLNIAEDMGDIKKLINLSYTSSYYKGQTALHIAIERRNTYYVKKLVEKGADLYAKACGKLFQPDSSEPSFYFGELPLSLAACTNQPELVDFLLGASASVVEQDSHGNTVLHALVMVADDDSHHNTRFITAMYDHILLATAKVNTDWRLESIQNKEGLTPLKLAAKTGKVELFKHLLQREFKNKDTKHLSRKFTEWAYGPISCSLYDLDSLDTYDDDRSILELVVYGSDNPRRLDLLQVEPLCGLLNEKWNQFAGRLFLLHFLVYLLYLGAFTTIAYNKKDMHPFQSVKTARGYMYIVVRLITVIASIYFFLRGIVDLMRKRPKLNTFLIDGYYDVLFSTQGLLFLVSAALYLVSRSEYLGFMILSMVLGWVNLLYFTRGLERIGVYSVMIQKVLTGDIIPFFLIYVVFLSGFSAAIVTMLTDQPQWMGEESEPPSCTVEADCKGPDFRDITYTALELFKLTIGMGDLSFSKGYKYEELLYLLLIGYIVLTYVLLFNMLIALMSHTVEETAKESTRIWKLQRAITTLDLEWGLPRCVRSRLRSGVEKDLSGGGMANEQGRRWCFRVEEVDWSEWRVNLGNIREEPMSTPKTPTAPPAPMDKSRRIRNVLWLFRQRSSKEQQLENEA